MVLKDEQKEREREAAAELAARRPKPRNIRALVDEYRFEAAMSMVERAAHFFDWLAKKAPYQLCPPNLAVKAVTGFARLPKETSDEVMRFRARGTSIRAALGRVYGRGFNVEAPLGMMRATVDDDDLASTQQVREVKRVRSSVNAVKRTNGLISPSKVRDPGIRKWLNTGVAPLLKALEDDDRLFRLLPEKPKDDDDDKGKK